MKDEAHYTGRAILAPMVRVGTLPMRLLALDCGADLAYTEEIIDHLILSCERKENAVLNTIDFYTGGNPANVVLRTAPEEKGKTVFQLGTCDATRAVAAGKLVLDDVSGVDVNMGCPKSFSLSGGMGAALLTKPELINEILSAMVSNLSIPVTCKIRLRDKLEDTLELCKLIERTGVSALAVHGRTKEQRPRHPNDYEAIGAIAKMLSIPVIANGCADEITHHSDILKIKERTSTSSVMLARTAMRNPSIFRPEGLLSVDDVIEMYIKKAVDCENDVQNTKYVVQQMLREDQTLTERGRKFLNSSTMREIW